MFSIIAAILFLLIIIMTGLVACGLPLGEFTMGGQYKILSKKMRIMAIVSMIIQALGIVIVLQAGGYTSLWFSFKTTKYICFFFAGYLCLNVLMNLSSKSKKEKYVMSSISLITAISFWVTALQM